MRRINATAAAEGVRPIIFSTLVQEDMREIVKRANGLFLDFFDAFLGPLEQELKVRSSRARAGARHGRHRRLHAAHQRHEFRAGQRRRRSHARLRARGSDPGRRVALGQDAHMPVPGVQYGIFAANFPFTDEEFESGELPAVAGDRPSQAVRPDDRARAPPADPQRARPNSQYSSPSQVEYEVRAAEAIFRRYDIPCINTTECSIEEIASRILDKTGVERRLRP